MPGEIRASCGGTSARRWSPCARPASSAPCISSSRPGCFQPRGHGPCAALRRADGGPRSRWSFATRAGSSADKRQDPRLRARHRAWCTLSWTAPGLRKLVPCVWEVTNPELAMVRLHGRNRATWNIKGRRVERFDYWYSDESWRDRAGHPTRRRAGQAQCTCCSTPTTRTRDRWRAHAAATAGAAGRLASAAVGTRAARLVAIQSLRSFDEVMRFHTLVLAAALFTAAAGTQMKLPAASRPLLPSPHGTRASGHRRASGSSRTPGPNAEKEARSSWPPVAG